MSGCGFDGDVWCEEVCLKERTPKDKLLYILGQYKDHMDQEIAHLISDRALLEYINDPEITEAFEKIEKWYA